MNREVIFDHRMKESLSSFNTSRVALMVSFRGQRGNWTHQTLNRYERVFIALMMKAPLKRRPISTTCVDISKLNTQISTKFILNNTDSEKHFLYLRY